MQITEVQTETDFIIYIQMQSYLGLETLRKN